MAKEEEAGKELRKGPVDGRDLHTEKCFTSEAFCYTFMMHHQHPSISQSRPFRLVVFCAFGTDTPAN